MTVEFDSREFRKALGAFPTGVAVLTTRSSTGACAGLTVNSFNSLSLDPPLVLWSLSTRSLSLAVFSESSHFAVNILAEDQVEISERFAARLPDKFSGLELTAGSGTAPLIAGCAAWIECSNHSRQDAGDHVLIIGRVENFACSGKKPLIFCNGKYLHVDREDAAAMSWLGWGP